ncbi:MAG: DUF1801 domain-containing protein [Reichenbachiella sp.]|uniref:DUF1801 domain-containing protein n=1 Tax=Reichenbachiella sp. TaxID=2184521 RepID=UPI0032639AED
MSEILDYISGLESPQKEIMTILDQMFHANDRMSSKIRFKVPFYYQKSWVCYLNPIKKGGVELCFIRANELSNENQLLDFKDRKQVAGISYFSIEEIDQRALNQVIQEALILDETVKYASKRKK